MEFSKGRRTWRLACLCACVIALAACGGGGGGDNGSTDAPSQPSNRAPIAYAGPDLTVFRGDEIKLSGAASSDLDGQALSYSWVQESGPTIGLTQPSSSET